MDVVGTTTTTAAFRKRSRSTSPPPSGTAATGQQQYSPQDLALAAGLQDVQKRNVTLNQLLQASARHESNLALSGDLILNTLADICVYDCLEWPGEDDKDNDSFASSLVMDHDSNTPPTFSSQETWLRPPTRRMTAWIQHCQQQLDPKRSCLKAHQWQTLHVILVILRNLSFVGANHRLLAYSPNILAILVGCLYESYDPAYDSLGVMQLGNNANNNTAAAVVSSNPGNMTLALSAIQTLVHLAPHLDVSGQKLLSDKLFYNVRANTADTGAPMVPHAHTFGLASTGNWGFGAIWLSKRLDTKEDTVADVDKDFILRLTAPQLVGVWSVFSGITHMLTDVKSPRPVLLMAVDLLQELISQARVGVIGSVQLQDKQDEIPALRAILVNMPDSILERLTDFLFVPRLGPDGLDYVDPLHHVVTRVTTLKLLMGYDATVDTDVRDRTLDVLVPLLELDSPRMAGRLGRETVANGGSNAYYKTRTRLFDALVPILTTQVGRNEASMLASQLFRELSKSTDNKLGLDYVQDRLVELASRNARVSQLVWNHLYAIPDDDASEEEEGSDEEEGSGSGGGSEEEEEDGSGSEDGEEKSETD